MIFIYILLSFILTENTEIHFSHPIQSRYGVIVTDNYCSSIYLITDNNINTIMSFPGCGRYLNFSENRNLIGFKIIIEDGLQIPAVYELGTGVLHELFRPSQKIGQVSFSKNSVAFTVDKTLYIIDETGERAYNIGYYSNITPISPDGKYVIFNNERDQLFILNLLTDERTALTSSGKGYYNPIWSPDGRFIVYSSLRGEIEIYDIISDSKYHIGEGFSYCWSPDSRYILFHKIQTEGYALKNSDIFLVLFDGTEIDQLTFTDDVFEMDPCFTDSDEIIFHTYLSNEIFTAQLVDNKLENLRLLYRLNIPLNIKFKNNFIKTTAKDSIDVPYLHQVYDSPDWFNGHWACAPTCAMMVIAHYRKLPVWNCWCSTPFGHYSKYGRYICERYHFNEVDYDWEALDPNNNPAKGGYGFMWFGSYSPYSRMSTYIANHGINSQRDDTPTFNETTVEIDSGYPYSMCVGLTASGHLVLVVGQVLSWHTLIFNDPYGNKNTSGYPSYDGKFARYDWPGYNNGYQNLNNVYWCTTSRGVLEEPADTIVDDKNLYNGFYLHTEPPSSMIYWHDELSGYNGHYWWTYTTQADIDTCYATWTPILPQPGSYEIFVYIPESHSSAVNSYYQIYYLGGIDTVILDQSLYSDQWISIGTYSFDTSGSLYLGDASTIQGQYIAFDAVKWSYSGSHVEESHNQGNIEFKVSCNYSFLFIEHPYQDDFELKIYDITGRNINYQVMSCYDGENNLMIIDISDFSSGSYILGLSTEIEKHFRKFVVLR